MATAKLTAAEQKVMTSLVDAWNAFIALPAEHGDDLGEFRHGIHALQNMVMSRPTRRAMGKEDR